MSSILSRIDETITSVLSDWNYISTILVGVIVAFWIGSLFLSTEADTHPLLLARQSNVSTVRQPGESGSYRHLSIFAGQPLVSGLEIKDEKAAAWQPGRNADVRDILRKAVKGDTAVFTVLGTDPSVKHEWSDIAKAVNAISNYLSKKGAKQVAIHLPNSIEQLEALFACCFANITPILLPKESSTVLAGHLKQLKPDFLITTAGSINLSELVEEYKGLKQIIWVVPKASRHMDFEHVPEGLSANLEDVNVWHDLITESKASADLPEYIDISNPTSIITSWQTKDEKIQKFISISQQQLLSGIAAVITTIPPKERLRPADFFLSTDHLSYSYALAHTLAALYSQSSILLVAAASRSLDLQSLMLNYDINPTVLLVSEQSLEKLKKEVITPPSGILQTIKVILRTRSLAAGHLIHGPANNGPRNVLGRLRLLYATHPIETGSSIATAQDFLFYRAVLGTQVVYALTSEHVVGPVAQSGVYDYRTGQHKTAHFGSPSTSIGLSLKDHDKFRVTEDEVKGQIYVEGPSVIGQGEVSLDAVGEMYDDNTLGLISEGI